MRHKVLILAKFALNLQLRIISINDSLNFKMDTNSEAYKSGEYKEIFESAETGLLAAEDYELYSA